MNKSECITPLGKFFGQFDDIKLISSLIVPNEFGITLLNLFKQLRYILFQKFYH